jgi:hydroxymethylpyrimidine pyrophosphatase-like HAD family hydrolase
MSDNKYSHWIGVDLDGTLAGQHEGDEIGEPVPAMIDRVKLWLEEGKEVRLFTSRAYAMTKEQLHAINEWLIQNIGETIPITCEKDPGCVQIWDDRAIQIIKNTGERADGEL